MNSSLYKLIQIPTISDEGSLSFAEVHKHIPFAIKRFYLIYNADDGNVRGKHAHRNLQQVLFCIKGSLTVVLDDGTSREQVILDDPSKGVVLGNMVWREMHGFTKDTIVFVVASEFYQESDYIRDYAKFLEFVKESTMEPMTTRKRLANLWGKLQHTIQKGAV